jgi:hypothetical protein
METLSRMSWQTKIGQCIGKGSIYYMILSAVWNGSTSNIFMADDQMSSDDCDAAK